MIETAVAQVMKARYIGDMKHGPMEYMQWWQRWKCVTLTVSDDKEVALKSLKAGGTWL